MIMPPAYRVQLHMAGIQVDSIVSCLISCFDQYSAIDSNGIRKHRKICRTPNHEQIADIAVTQALDTELIRAIDLVNVERKQVIAWLHQGSRSLALFHGVPQSVSEAESTINESFQLPRILVYPFVYSQIRQFRQDLFLRLQEFHQVVLLGCGLDTRPQR